MAALDRGWREVLDKVAQERRAPVLGICLGMQLLCRKSEEGQASGLGWIAADVKRLDTGGDPRLKLPHMGWADVQAVRANPLIPENEEQRFYHDHGFRAVCDELADVIATANYGTEFTTAVGHGNILGVQFHPEKSHRFGMALLRRFASLPC
jgi:glutamine amidotransferase